MAVEKGYFGRCVCADGDAGSVFVCAPVRLCACVCMGVCLFLDQEDQISRRQISSNL